MKKFLAIILSFVMIIGIIPLAAFAENGPCTTPFVIDDDEEFYLAYLRIYGYNESGDEVVYTFFKNNTAYEDVFPGISYDLGTNILTLSPDEDAYTEDLIIEANMMGDDFKIRVDSDCEFQGIVVYGDSYDGNLTITGYRTLTVNADKEMESAIIMYGEGTQARLSIEGDVNVILYGDPYAVMTLGSTASSVDEAFYFENSQEETIIKPPYTYYTYDQADVIYATGKSAYPIGSLGYSSSDPDGIYVITYGYRDNEDETLYWVTKYVYLERYDGYIKDSDYFVDDPRVNSWGELEFTEEEWNNQDEYGYVLTLTDNPAILYYKDDSCFGTNTSYGKNMVKSASDTEGLYGYSKYTMTSNNITTEYVEISRFVYDDEHECNIEDESYTHVEMTREAFDNSDEWSIVYAQEETSLYSPTFSYGGYLVFLDEDNNKYVKGHTYNSVSGNYEEHAYLIDENYTAVVGGICYYLLGEASDIDPDTLEGTYYEVVTDGLYNYYLDSGKFTYTGSNNAHVHNFGDIVIDKKPSGTTMGEKSRHCSVCGERTDITYYIDSSKPTVTNTTAGVKIAWSSMAGAAGYIVYRNDGSGYEKIATIKNATTLTYTDADAVSGKTYTYAVRGYNYNGSTLIRSDYTGVSLLRLENPAFTLANTADGVKVTITKTAGAKGYYVYRKTGSGSYSKIGTTTSLTYVDKTAKAGTAYTYTVRAYNGSVMSSYAGKSITRLTNPAFALANTKEGVKVTITKVAGAKGYYVYRKTGSGSYSKIGTTTSLTYVDKTAKAGTSYTYTVRAYNGSVMSAYAGKAIVRLANPTFKLANSSSGVKVTITKVAGAKGYYVYRKTGSGSYSKIGTTTSLTYVDKTAKSGTKYTYAVRAYNGSYMSTYNTAAITCKK